jgi:hypothetical protein
MRCAAGDTQGGGSPLVGGAGGIDACQRFWLARIVLPAWGEPARPGFPLGGNGKGGLNSLAQSNLARDEQLMLAASSVPGLLGSLLLGPRRQALA